MFNKPIEYWTVLVGLALYAVTRAEHGPIWRRITKIASGVMLAAGLSQTVAPLFSALPNPEIAALVVLVPFVVIVLDVITATLIGIAQDPEFIKAIIRKKLGVKNDDE